MPHLDQNQDLQTFSMYTVQPYQNYANHFDGNNIAATEVCLDAIPVCQQVQPVSVSSVSVKVVEKSQKTVQIGCKNFFCKSFENVFNNFFFY